MTSHICTEDFKLESFVFDTSEMKDTHTSENLIKHVDEVLIDFDLTEKNLAINFTIQTKAKIALLVKIIVKMLMNLLILMLVSLVIMMPHKLMFRID